MKKTFHISSICLLLLMVFSSFYTFSQNTSIKTKVVLAFTKKKQIKELNLKVDSLNTVIAGKNNLLALENEKTIALTNDFNIKCSNLNDDSTRVSELENE